ncbi:MAG TPA: hypothetical protein VFE61_12040 [Candidatus Sulfotelmatobacter sp.]|jgi:hypothetical protein|nr:hypothetical protein [Candidatus Sulfotelmatobacter sp.]
MSNETNHTNPASNGGYERSDIGASGVLYFLLGLAVAGLLVYFVVAGLYAYMNKRSEAQQPPVNPLVTTAPADTRSIPRDYPQGAFPNPKLEEDERGQLNSMRLKEEQTLSTYDYVDKNAGTIRIPIDRAMDLIAQRGLPVRAQAASPESPAATQEAKSVATNAEKTAAGKKKATK